jgi:hypothetical protein
MITRHMMTSASSILLLLLRCDTLQISVHMQNNQHAAGTTGILCDVLQGEFLRNVM